MEKRCLLMSTFHWSEAYTCEELSGSQGWAYYSWAIENRATVWGSNIERVGKGYVGQEVQRLKKAQ